MGTEKVVIIYRDKMDPRQINPNKPEKDFDANSVAEVIDKRRISSVKLFKTGKSNSTWKITTSSNEHFIYRLYSRDVIDKELYILEFVKHFIPVPEVVHVGKNFLLLSYIEGELLCNRPEYTYKAAEMIIKISSFTFDSPGQITGSGGIEAWDFPEPYGFYSYITSQPSVKKLLGPKRLDKTLGMLDKRSQELSCLLKSASLVHGDFNPTNILINNGEISGIIDWEFALSGTPFMDLGNLMRNCDPSHHQSIYQTLKQRGDFLTENWKEKAELVDFSSLLEFLSTSVSYSFKKECLKRIDKTLNKLS